MNDVIVVISTIGFAGLSWLMLVTSDWLLGDKPKAKPGSGTVYSRQPFPENRRSMGKRHFLRGLTT